MIEVQCTKCLELIEAPQDFVEIRTKWMNEFICWKCIPINDGIHPF